MFERIPTNPLVLHGEPCIRGMRIPVHLVAEMVAAGMTREEILRNYSDLEPADIQAALEYAAYVTRERFIPIRVTA
jgi:uncharacterized protein (DUF433 family)